MILTMPSLKETVGSKVTKLVFEIQYKKLILCKQQIEKSYELSRVLIFNSGIFWASL